MYHLLDLMSVNHLHKNMTRHKNIHYCTKYILKHDRRIFFSAQTCLSRDVSLDSFFACISELI